MPKKRTVTTFSIDELSPEARTRAIDRIRHEAFDDSDAHMLTEEFEQQLEEKGIDNPKANWSLGYCQGDGVCFKGTIDSVKVIKENKLKEFKPLLPAAQLGLLSGRIHHEGTRSCHWNSMTVDLELRGSVEDLLPRDLLERYRYWEMERRSVFSRWGSERYNVQQRNMQPIRDWERHVEEWKRRDINVKDWSPRDPRFKPPGPKPPIGTEQDPPEPVFPMPEDLAAAIAAKQQDWKTIETLTDKYREWLEEWVKNVSRELEKLGYEEIEYRQSDEAIAEYFRNRDAQFLEDGEEFEA